MSNQQLQKVKVKRLAHVGLWTSDLAAQTRFYRQVVSLQLRAFLDLSDPPEGEPDSSQVFFHLGDEYHCLALFHDFRSQAPFSRRAGATVPLRSSLHHLSFEVDSDAELAALAARLQMSGTEVNIGPRDGDEELGDTLWLQDPDGNRIEISVTPDDFHLYPDSHGAPRQAAIQPSNLQHIALQTPHLETLVEFYTEALGFDISDWLLRERAWLRCNSQHHTILLIQGPRPAIDHLGFCITHEFDLIQWADHLSHVQVPLLWGPGRHGPGGDLFLRIADPDGTHIELSAGLQRYYDRDVTAPPRLWHTRSSALNLWGASPPWLLSNVTKPSSNS